MTGTIQEFDFNVNVLKAILWQYENAPNLKSILQQKQDWYNTNQTQFWTDFYNNVFNLKTANAFGLAVWAIILGQPTTFQLAGDPSVHPWGFGTNGAVNFGLGNFFYGGGTTYTLSLETSRVILRLRYYKLIGTVQIPSINRALKDIFAADYGPVWVLDNHDMSMTYNFGFDVPSDMQFAFDNIDILPRLAAVNVSWRTIEPGLSFAFDQYRGNFDQSNFYPG